MLLKDIGGNLNNNKLEYTCHLRHDKNDGTHMCICVWERNQDAFNLRSGWNQHLSLMKNQNSWDL